MFRVEVIFNNNQVMTEGIGNTKKQAERNASINGLSFLRVGGYLPENMGATCSGLGVKHSNYNM